MATEFGPLAHQGGEAWGILDSWSGKGGGGGPELSELTRTRKNSEKKTLGACRPRGIFLCRRTEKRDRRRDEKKIGSTGVRLRKGSDDEKDRKICAGVAREDREGRPAAEAL